MRTAVIAALGLALLPALAGCGGDEDERAAGAGNAALPAVYTTFYPTTYLVRRLGGTDVRIVCPLPRNQDPGTWEPDAATIAELRRAALVVLGGAGLEKWVSHANLPEDHVVDTSSAFDDELLVYENPVEHAHGPSGTHVRQGVDEHVWLDPVLARLQAEEIAAALGRLLPEQADAIDKRLDRLLADLDSLDESFGKLTASYDGEAILTAHPTYNYLARRYDWNLVNLDLDPATVTDAATMARLEAVLDENPARYVLWESAPPEAVAKRLKEDLGLECVVFSSCATTPPGGRDYLAEMQANLFRLGPVLAPTRETSGD